MLASKTALTFLVALLFLSIVTLLYFHWEQPDRVRDLNTLAWMLEQRDTKKDEGGDAYFVHDIKITTSVLCLH